MGDTRICRILKLQDDWMLLPAIISRTAPLRGSAKWSPPCPAGLSKRSHCLRIVRYSHMVTTADFEKRLTQSDAPNTRSRARKTSPRKAEFVPPSQLIASYIRNRNKTPTWDAWKLAQEAATSDSSRLPIVTLQYMMRRDEAEKPTSLSECFRDDTKWRHRLNSLAFKGINVSDLDHWSWILMANDADSRIKRFTEVEDHKPIFILYQLLAKEEIILKGESLLALLNYISVHYCRAPVGSPLPFGAVRRSLASRENMAPKDFIDLLRLLVHHVMQVWPSAIAAVAQVTADYIKTVPMDLQSRSSTGYAQRCAVFNSAIQLFERPARVQPLKHRIDNWKAQKLLLTMSMDLEKPLIITKEGYRAVRMVMIGLPKSDAEQRIASRLMSSWPPYKEVWDGMDERRQPEDDLSMSVRADTLSREAGYPEQAFDRALGLLGGATLDQSPSIQTRSLPPARRKRSRDDHNRFIEWAARVKATRNAHEAWQIFNQSSEYSAKPNYLVYAEMFSKMFAKEVAMPRDLPGDGRETFPFHDVNLTDIEKARLAPPTVGLLYKRMLDDGERPRGKCLALLIQHAYDTDAALQYLNDSLLDEDAVEALTSSNRPDLNALSKIPLPIFNAYIRLLCRIQPPFLERERPFQHTEPFMKRFIYLKRAVLLLGSRFPASVVSKESSYKAPWYHVLITLAFRNKALHPDLDMRKNDTSLLVLFLRLLERQKVVMEVDPMVFFLLNRMVKKALRWRIDDPAGITERVESSNNKARSSLNLAVHDRIPSEHNVNGIIDFAYGKLKRMFKALTTPAKPQSATIGDLEVPGLFHPISGHHIHTYLRTLAMLGDEDEMVRVMKWVLQAWELESVLDEAKDPANRVSYTPVARAFIFFRAYGDRRMDPAVVGRVEERLRELNKKGCSWCWPTDEEVEDYINSDDQDFVPYLYYQPRHEQIENSSAGHQGEGPTADALENEFFAYDLEGRRGEEEDWDFGQVEYEKAEDDSSLEK